MNLRENSITFEYKITDENLVEKLKRLMGSNMRFEIEKIEDEPITLIYGDIYTIKDNMDENSPVNTFRFIKPNAEMVCDWLNENVLVEPSEVESFDDRVNKAIKKLWKPHEYELRVFDDLYVVVEIRDTEVCSSDIEEAMPDAIVEYESPTYDKAVYFITEDKDEIR